jgi:[ribosomal protein S5]-alanine N-acetyltransferase
MQAQKIDLETNRFRLSLISKKDVDAVFETMNSRPTADIISFLKWPMTKDQASSWCARSEKGWAEKKEYLFLARNKEDGSPVGCISLHLEHANTGEVGYWVSEKWQGVGCATELLKAIIDLAFNTFDLSSLIATASVENPISLHVLQKQGFTIIGKKDLPTAKGTILHCHLLELNS